MFIYLSNIQNGDRVRVDPVIDSREQDMEVALSEITYYPAWVNISAAQDNNYFHFGADKITIPDGYYDVCTLDERVFAPLLIRLALNPATGLVSIYNIKVYMDLGNLGPTLGFTNLKPPVVNGISTADTFPKLVIHKELFVHLHGLSTSMNRHNQFPSTLLRAISVGREECNSGRIETFSRPIFKRLETGTLSNIEISIRDKDNKLVKFVYLSCLLEIRPSTNHESWLIRKDLEPINHEPARA